MVLKMKSKQPVTRAYVEVESLQCTALGWVFLGQEICCSVGGRRERRGRDMYEVT